MLEAQGLLTNFLSFGYLRFTTGKSKAERTNMLFQRPQKEEPALKAPVRIT